MAVFGWERERERERTAVVVRWFYYDLDRVSDSRSEILIVANEMRRGGRLVSHFDPNRPLILNQARWFNQRLDSVSAGSDASNCKYHSTD